MAKVAKTKKSGRRNPVAKFVGKVNKPVVHKDKKKTAKQGITKYPPDLLDE